MSNSMSYKTDKDMNQKHLKILNELLQRPENKECADCSSKGPRWASTNLGVFICIRCAGIHRNLGTHISKVRSTTLDSWTPEQIQIIVKMGNDKARSIYEAKLPSNKKKPDENEDSRVVEQWIRAKYERKIYTDEDALRSFQENPDGPVAVKTEKKKKKKPVKEDSDEESGNLQPSSNGSSPSPLSPTTTIQQPSKSIPQSQPNSMAPKPKPKPVSQPVTPVSTQASVSLIDFGETNTNNQQQLMQFVAPNTSSSAIPSSKTPTEQFAPPAKDSSQVKDSILSLFQQPTPQHPTNNYYNPQGYYAPNGPNVYNMRGPGMQGMPQQPAYANNAYVMPGAMYGHQQSIYPNNQMMGNPYLLQQQQQQQQFYQNNLQQQQRPNVGVQNPNYYASVPQRPTSAPPANWGNGYQK